MKTHSFANTPLNAAHAPLVTAKKSHADFVCGVDMASCCALVLRNSVMCSGEVDAATAAIGPPSLVNSVLSRLKTQIYEGRVKTRYVIYA